MLQSNKQRGCKTMSTHVASPRLSHYKRRGAIAVQLALIPAGFAAISMTLSMIFDLLR